MDVFILTLTLLALCCDSCLATVHASTITNSARTKVSQPEWSPSALEVFDAAGQRPRDGANNDHDSYEDGETGVVPEKSATHSRTPRAYLKLRNPRHQRKTLLSSSKLSDLSFSASSSSSSSSSYSSSSSSAPSFYSIVRVSTSVPYGNTSAPESRNKHAFYRARKRAAARKSTYKHAGIRKKEDRNTGAPATVDKSGGSQSLRAVNRVDSKTGFSVSEAMLHNGMSEIPSDDWSNRSSQSLSDDLLLGQQSALSSLSRFPQQTFNFTWPVQEAASIVEGDLVLGALHMIHERSQEFVCGHVMEQGGIQALEATLYTLDYVNGLGGSPPLIPGVKLGILAKDDCDTDILGLEQALDFIRGSISNIGGSAYKCLDGSSPENDVKIISGVLGAPSSQTSIQVANLLKLFKIPQISFFSTSAALSSRERFPYFLRTIPSDVYQAEAIIALVKFFGWKYVSIVYEESSYGSSGYNELEKLIGQHDICFAAREKLLKDSGIPKEEDYLAIVENLLKKKLARGVIIFASDQEVAGLMRAVRRRGVTGRFSWIGSDGWGGRGLAYIGNEQEVEGAVTVLPQAEEVQGFKEYFLSLKPDNNTRNPWFIEFWEQYFKCRYPGSRETPFNRAYNRTCTGAEEIPADQFSMEAQLQFVSDSVLAFAHAFKEIHQRLCGGRPGMCERMTKINGENIRAHLLEVKFESLSGEKFQFLPNGDGPSRYRILNFRRNNQAGVYEWATVGYFRNGRLNVTSPVQFRASEPQHPASVCSRKCGRRQVIDPDRVDPCCWSCKDCQEYEYRPAATRCEECPMGTLPSFNMSQCLEIPQVYLRFTDVTALAAVAFSTMGMLATAGTALVFLLHANTPVVKASGRELSFVLLLGIFLCYTMTFLLITRPSKLVCGAQTVGIGFCFSVCYSAILTKTNRIARIFRAGQRTTRRPKFISPESQLVICASLVACQIIISLVWLLTSPPEAVPFYTNRADHQLVCEAAIGFAHMVGFSYPILLVLVCTVYAVVTRKIPEAFNESKHIGFTMYTTCIIWAAFVVIYLSTAHNIQVRLATMCFSISLSATVALLCMFTPKIYIILLRPERNVRQSMMAQKTAHYGAKMVMTNSSCSSLRVDSGTQSEDLELTQQLQSSGSLNSLSCGPPTSYNSNNAASQTTYGGHVCSANSQTLTSAARPAPPPHHPGLDHHQLWQDDDVHL